MLPALGADMAEGHAVIQDERGANRDGELSDASFGRVPELRDDQILRLDLDDWDV